jgi:hypothetical protein
VQENLGVHPLVLRRPTGPSHTEIASLVPEYAVAVPPPTAPLETPGYGWVCER